MKYRIDGIIKLMKGGNEEDKIQFEGGLVRDSNEIGEI